MAETEDRPSDEFQPRRWRRILLVSAAVLVLLVGVLTAVYLLVTRDPQKTLRSHLRKAGEFAKQNKHAEAITFYRKALVLAPDDEGIRRIIASSYVKLGKIPEAITEYTEYLHRKPDDRNGQLVLARLYLLSRNIYEAKRITDDILRMDPNDIGALTVRAQAHAREEQFDLAAEDLQKIISLAPGWAPAYVAMATLELKGRDPEEAEQYLKRAVAASPADIGAVMELARFYTAQKRLAEAEATLLTAIQDNPRNEEARLAFASFLSYIGRFDEALAQYGRILDEQPENVPAIAGSVGANLSKNDIPSTAPLIERLLKTKDGRVPGLYYRGLVGLLREKIDEAIKDLTLVAAENREHAPVQYLLGLAHLRKNDVKEARAHLARALQIEPNLIAAQLALADLLMATGSLTEAVAEAEDILKKQADNLGALLIAGQGYLLQRAPEKAEPYLEKSVEVDKRSVFGRLVLARIYRERGGEAEALKAYQEVIEINPNLAIPYFLVGTLYDDTRDYAKAIEHYKKAVEKDPTFPAALNNLAYAYAEHGGDLDEAQRIIEPLTGRFPKQHSIQDTFAWVLFKKGMYSDSLKILEGIAAAKREERPLIAYHYAFALYKNNRPNEARAEFEKVLPKIEDEEQKRQIELILSEIAART